MGNGRSSAREALRRGLHTGHSRSARGYAWPFALLLGVTCLAPWLEGVGLWEAPAREVWVRFGRLGSSVVGVGRGRKARQASGMKNP